MIPEFHRHEVRSDSAQESVSFEISQDDSAHIMGILRDQLYSDKILAVLREYPANAGDAHRDPRIPLDRRDAPFRVKLPTADDPTLEIQDYGPGLLPEEMVSVFAKYGKSTKRGSNDTVGFLGIGSKSGYAYADSFTIISRTEEAGALRCRTYVAVLDESERGKLCLLDDRPCAEGERSGLTIQIGVKSEDVAEFRAKGAQALRFYRPRPDVNVELPEEPTVDTVRGAGWTAVMGCIPYEVEVDHLGLPEYVAKSGGVAFFPIGALRVSASREKLKYDDHTKAALRAKLTEVVDAHVADTARSLGALSCWEKRLRVRGMALYSDILLPILGFSGFSNEVNLPAVDGLGIKFSAKSLVVSPSARVVFVDDTRAVSGYALTQVDLLVRRVGVTTYAEAWDALQGALKVAKLDGIPVVRTSELPWFQQRPAQRAKSARSKVRTFVFKPPKLKSSRRRYYSDEKLPALSKFWVAADVEPTDEDVYVLLERFQTPLYKRWADDVETIVALGLKVPTVYGYRKSDESEHAGVPYGEWVRDRLYDLAVAADPMVDRIATAIPYDWHDAYADHRAAERIADVLGAAHPVAALARKLSESTRILSDRRPSPALSRVEAVKDLVTRMLGRRDERPADLVAVEKSYPLLWGKMDGLAHPQQRGAWLEYVRGVDLLRQKGM